MYALRESGSAISDAEETQVATQNLGRWCIVLACLLLILAGMVSTGFAQQDEVLEINLARADMTLVGEEAADWAGYFASPAGDVNGDGLGDLLVGAPMAGNKVCPIPVPPGEPCPPPYVPKGEGVAYLVLGRPQGEWLQNPINLVHADASFLGCELNSMTARQLYTAGDVNGDGYDDFLVSGWKCGQDYIGKAYLFLGRPDVQSWGRYFPVEAADASFLGESEWDFLSYYVSTAGDVNADGFDDFFITATHFEYDAPCPPGTPENQCDCCTSFLVGTEILDSATVTGTASGDLNTARIRHSATLLPGDQVLVAGGQNDSSFLDSAELFHPKGGVWTTTGGLNIERSGHIAALLSSGKVLVVGGENDSGFLNSSELFNPVRGDWAITGVLSTARSGHTATVLLDGKVLVAGGQNDSGFLDSAEIFDPDTGAWMTTGGLNAARSGHTATLLPDGKVLATGGQNDSGFLSSAEIFDPTTEEWTTTAQLNTARAGHSATLLPSGQVLVAGGQSSTGFPYNSELFEPLSATWVTSGTLNSSRVDHTAALMADGTVLVVGGQDESGSRNIVEFFDPATATWEVYARLSTARTDHSMTVLSDGRVLVAGGRNCSDFGKVYLILGKAEADWGTDFSLAQADASFGGEAPLDRLGRAVTGVGDVNGDGYGDFVIGSISSDYGGIDAGQNYLFLGRATEGDPRYDPTRPWWGRDHLVAVADASFVGEAAGDESGRRVAWAGDVNGDGYDDFLMGAARNDQAGTQAGIAHLILGRPAADWGMRYPLAQADASFIGEHKLDQAGRRLNGAGDVNGDGYDDLLIGAPHNERGGALEGIIAGSTYLLYGRPAADWGTYFSLSQADIVYVGKQDVGVAGYDVAWLNDFDGDGLDDFLIAAYGGRHNNEEPGEVYVLLGSDAPVPAQFLPDMPRTYLGWRKFTTSYWDFDGWQDLSSLQLVLGRDVNDDEGINVKYELTEDSLYLYDREVPGWLGPCSPGEEVVLSNGVAWLDCKASSANGLGSRRLQLLLRARWLQPRSEPSNLYAYMRAVDRSGSDSGFADLAWGEDIAITMEDVRSTPTYPGGPLTFTLTFGNAGGTTVTGVVITDVVPAELIDVGFESSRPVTPTGSASFTWLVGSVAPMQGGVITLTGIINPVLQTGDTFTNTAIISGMGSTRNRNNSCSVALTLPFHMYLPAIEKQRQVRNLAAGDGSSQAGTRGE